MSAVESIPLQIARGNLQTNTIKYYSREDGLSFVEAGELAVHESSGPLPPGWIISHTRSGKALTRPIPKDDALNLMRRLLPVGDWSRTGPEIFADDEFRARARAVIGPAKWVPPITEDWP